MDPVPSLSSYVSWCRESNKFYLELLKDTKLDWLVARREKIEAEEKILKAIADALMYGALDRLPEETRIHYACLNIIAATYAVWGWGAAREGADPLHLRQQARDCRDEMLKALDELRARPNNLSMRRTG